MRPYTNAALAVALALVWAAPASAHSGHGTDGLASGFLHPFMGLDHLLAMIAVGVWGALLGRTMIWLLPAAFVAVMVAGGALGILGYGAPLVEAAISVSVIVLGLAIALKWRAPVPVALVLVGLFAFFHGHAHGGELPLASNAFGYILGFVVATSIIHLVGVVLGLWIKRSHGQWAVRVGAIVAAAGAYFLIGAVGVS